MKQENEHIDDLIVQLLCGELDDSSLAELRAWTNKSTEHMKYFQEGQEIWFSAVDASQLEKYNKNEAFSEFMKNVAQTQETQSCAQNHHPIAWRKWMSYAAIVTFIIATLFFAYQRGAHDMRENFADIQVEAPYGSRTKTLLPDGTVVWLNAGSKLSYSQGYGLNDRKVSIVGEGYFSVKHDEKLPFSVSSKDLTVKVLGTKFNFRDYPEDEVAEIMLEQGSVKLDNKLTKDQHSHIMIPGQKVILDKRTGKLTAESCDVNTISQWSNGLIVFNDATLDEIAKRIERSYNIKVQISSKAMKKYRFNGDFVRQEQSLKEVLDALAATNKLHYRIKDRVVTIY